MSADLTEGGKILSNELKGVSFNIWEGIYECFQSAKANSVGSGFSGEIYIERSLAAAQECINALNSNKPIPQFYKQRSNLLPMVVALTVKQDLSVLDFGGGLGIGYMTLQESIPEVLSKVRYTIIEVPEVCKVGERLNLDTKRERVNYLSSIPTSTHFDIVHASSSLQYIEHWQDWVSMISALGSEYILLSDVFAGEIDSFVTLQNYYGSRIPHWFLNLDELLRTFKSCGYHLVMKGSVTSRRLNHYDVLPMDNFPDHRRLAESLHLLFKARDA